MVIRFFIKFFDGFRTKKQKPAPLSPSLLLQKQSLFMKFHMSMRNWLHFVFKWRLFVLCQWSIERQIVKIHIKVLWKSIILLSKSFQAACWNSDMIWGICWTRLLYLYLFFFHIKLQVLTFRIQTHYFIEFRQKNSLKTFHSIYFSEW